METDKYRDRLELALSMGESHFREFKSGLIKSGIKERRKNDVKSIVNDIERILVGFANSDGGELYLGIDDNGKVIGIEYSGPEIRFIVDELKSRLIDKKGVPKFEFMEIIYNHKSILIFTISKSETLLSTSNKELYKREGFQTTKFELNELKVNSHRANTIFQKWKELIVKDKLEEVLDDALYGTEFKDKGEYEEQFILIYSKLNSVKTDRITGIIQLSEARRERILIAKSLLDLIRMINTVPNKS